PGDIGAESCPARSVNRRGTDDRYREILVASSFPDRRLAHAFRTIVGEPGIGQRVGFFARVWRISVDICRADVQKSLQVRRFGGGPQEILYSSHIGFVINRPRRPIGGASGAVVDMRDAADSAGQALD